jgi:hypothetical protein
MTLCKVDLRWESIFSMLNLVSRLLLQECSVVRNDHLYLVKKNHGEYHIVEYIIWLIAIYGPN